MANDLIKVVTPVGSLHWVNISGQGKENYNEDGYVYVATVHLSGKPAEDLIAKIEEVLGDPGKLTVKSKGYRELLEDEDGKLFTPTAKNSEGKATGIYAFTFSTGTTFTDGKPKSINIYDTNGVKTSIGDKRIGNGSIGAISGNMKKFVRGPAKAQETGVSLFLNAIQLVKFVEYSDDGGFEAQDGDFTGNTDEETGFKAQPQQEEVAEKKTSKPRL